MKSPIEISYLPAFQPLRSPSASQALMKDLMTSIYSAPVHRESFDLGLSVPLRIPISSRCFRRQAASRKYSKYSVLSQSYFFQPIAVKTSDVIWIYTRPPEGEQNNNNNNNTLCTQYVNWYKCSLIIIIIIIIIIIHYALNMSN
jgi:hypothetical protein